MTVVDASVAAKWLMAEADSGLARKLLFAGRRLLAPALVRVEVAAIVTKKHRRKELAQADAGQAFRLWSYLLDLGRVELSPDSLDLAKAFDLSMNLQACLPDCLYLALALRRTTELVTADARFVRNVSARFPNVRLLAALP